MKKYIICVLLTCLLFSCFTGCKQNDVTPTDVTPLDTTPVESVDNTLTEQPNDVVNEQVPQNSESKVQDKSDGNKSATTDDNKEDKTQTEQPKMSADEIHGMVARDEPTFLSEAGFRTWLTQGSGRYEEERVAALQQATNQKFVYYRPANGLSAYGELSEMTYFTAHSYFNYVYKMDGLVSIDMSYHLAESGIDQRYEEGKAAYEAKKQGYYYVRINDIDYYYTSSMILWKQFGHTCVAFVERNKNKTEEIIPLLKFEQVSVNLNSDHVTE